MPTAAHRTLLSISRDERKLSGNSSHVPLPGSDFSNTHGPSASRLRWDETLSTFLTRDDQVDGDPRRPGRPNPTWFETIPHLAPLTIQLKPVDYFLRFLRGLFALRRTPRTETGNDRAERRERNWYGG